jgi:hypothetical protein
LLGCIGIVGVANAQEVSQEHLRQVFSCGADEFGKPPAEVGEAFKRKNLGPAYKNALMVGMSPYSLNRDRLSKLDPQTIEGLVGLIYLNSFEVSRGRDLADAKPADAMRMVLYFFMSAAKGGECAPPADFKAWVDGYSYDKLGTQADFDGMPFDKLDFEQSDVVICAGHKAAPNGQPVPYAQIARSIISLGDADQLESDARTVLAGSPFAEQMDSWAKMPESEFAKYGLKDRNEERVFNALAALMGNAAKDQDYARRMKSRLVFAHHVSLTTSGECKLPADVSHFIEKLHADHH